VKRDFNVIRAILLKVEEAPPNSDLTHIEVDGINPEVVTEHIALLFDAKYLEGVIEGNSGGYFYCVQRMTWSGHNFLANAKNDTIWKKVMTQAQEKGVSVSVSILESLLSKAAERYLGIEDTKE
jgi:hypothetical protein